MKQGYFVTLGGPVIFSEIKLLFPTKNVASITYEEMTTKLKSRLDKKESDLIQRWKFNNRVQQPNESVEDFILSVKLQAEYCTFENFKNAAIRDRILAGLKDDALRQRLMSEENLTLESMERIIATWEMAGANNRCVTGTGTVSLDQIAFLRNQGLGGQALNKLANAYQMASGSGRQNPSPRGPVKSRLGYKHNNQHNNQFYGERSQGKFNDRRGDRRYNERYNAYKPDKSRPREWKQEENRQRPNYPKEVCEFCGVEGHPKRKCFKLKNMRRDTVNLVDTFNSGPSVDGDISELMNRMRADDSDSDGGNSSGDLECMMISSINKINEPCVVVVSIEDKLLRMEIDCGSSVSVISKERYFSNFNIPLKKYDKQLIVVNGQKLKIEGEANVSVEFNGLKTQLQLLVLNCSNDFIPLMGRTWLDVFFQNWRHFFSNSLAVNNMLMINQTNEVEEIRKKFSQVFLKDFSKPIKGFQADLVIKSDVPIFKKAYDVPYRLKDKVIDYLNRLERENVISPVKTSEWASPVIIVMKKNNEIRLVIDCKVSINKVIIPNTYPLPVAQDLFASLAGCKIFCALDLEGAYTQLALSERSRRFMVINTIKGLYVYNRLPQGASSSASIFQQIMDQVLEGIDYVYCYLDDVLIAGKDLNECRQRLHVVLKRLSDANIKVNWEKCKFFVTKLTYLGHVICDKGLLPCQDKISTIQHAKVPKNVTELKSFLGLINYYNKFIPNLSSKLYYLYNLLRNDVKFIWNDNCQTAFDDSKKALLETHFLEFYDPKKPIVVVTDASGYGLGGVIAHIVDGVEKPICFTSFTLNDAQKSYPILHLEALALVCTIKKFHKYLYGQTFTLFTDHKPLVAIFGKTGKHSIFVTRLQRYILELSIYDYEIQYRPSAKMGNADFCSRFPLEQLVPIEYDTENIRSINFGKELPIDHTIIAKLTKVDKFLQEVISYMKNGWPKRMDKCFVDVFSNQQDLEIVEECLLYQDRVIIPQQMQKEVLKLLHANHSGIVKMKQLARRTVYWFGINKDIERFVSSCDVCTSMATVSNPKVKSQWTPTLKPFSRIHIDFFFFEHRTFLLIIDSFSKWLEVEWMRNGTDCGKVLKILVEFFARYGLPDVLVSDNGPPFNAHAFIQFLERQGIIVMKSPPYNPSSNGQAERLVRTVKDVLKKFLLDQEYAGIELEDQINLFLINYRNNCLTEDGRFPSENIFSFLPKQLIDLVNPKKHYKSNLTQKHEIINDDSVRTNNDANLAIDPFNNLMEGDVIWYKNNNRHIPAKWIKCNFLKQFSKNTFQIMIGSVPITAHRNQLRLPKTLDTPTRPTVTTRIDRPVAESVQDLGNQGGSGSSPELPRVPIRKRKQAFVDKAIGEPRRSKRVRKEKHDKDYVYS